MTGNFMAWATTVSSHELRASVTGQEEPQGLVHLQGLHEQSRVRSPELMTGNLMAWATTVSSHELRVKLQDSIQRNSPPLDLLRWGF